MLIIIVILSLVAPILGDFVRLPFDDFGRDISRSTLVALRTSGLLYISGPDVSCQQGSLSGFNVYNASSNDNNRYNFKYITGCGKVLGTTLESENLAIFLSANTVEMIKGTQTYNSTSTVFERQGLISLSNKKLTFFYGYRDSRNPNNFVEVYNFNNNSWFNFNLSSYRNDMSVTVLENYGLVFFAGGFNYNPISESNKLDIYNAKINVLSVKQLSVARSFISTSSLLNKAFFAGGVTAGSKDAPPNLYTIVDVYDAATDYLTTTSINPPRLGSGTFSIENMGAYFVGGKTNNTISPIISNIISIYKPDDTWTNLNAPYPFIGSSVVLPNQKLIFLLYQTSIMVLGMCSPGSYISVNPSTCLTCPQGYYCDGVNVSPMICPSGTICNAGSSFPQTTPAPAPAPAPPSGPTPPSGPSLVPSTSNTASNDCSGLSCYGDSKSIGIGIVVGLFGISFPLLLIYLISGTRKRLHIIRSAGLPVTFKRLVFMDDLQFDDMKSMTAVTSKN